MTRYILTSTITGNTLDLTYNHIGQLYEVRLDGEFDMEAHTKAFTNMPLTLEKYKSINWKNTTIQEVPTDLSFDKFWNTYKEKRGKVEAEKHWEKLSDAERMAVLVSIPKYDKWLLTKPGREKKDPATYINPKKRNWEDDFTITKAAIR